MIKGLEALAELYSYIKPGFDYQTAKAVEDYKIIEKELKALRIIEDKNVNVARLKTADVLPQYNKKLHEHEMPLTDGEYLLLRNVLLQQKLEQKEWELVKGVFKQ